MAIIRERVSIEFDRYVNGKKVGNGKKTFNNLSIDAANALFKADNQKVVIDVLRYELNKPEKGNSGITRSN